jgi:hypothetical protein
MATKGEKMDVSDGELESDEEGLEVEKKSVSSSQNKFRVLLSPKVIPRIFF